MVLAANSHATSQCSHVLAGQLPGKSEANLIILNLYKEASGIVGRRVSIDFKDREPLRNVKVLSFDVKPFKLPSGLLQDQIFITYVKDGVEQKLFPGDVAAITSIGVKVTPGKRAISYERETKEWTEYRMGTAFAVPELPDGSWLSNNEAIGQTVSLLTFPLVNGQRPETHSRVVTGKLIGWPIYHGPRHDGNHTYTILTPDGKKVEVDMDAVRRFKIKPPSTSSSN